MSTGRKKEGMLFFGIESAAALIVSLFINVCVVSVFAKGFYGKGIENIGLENAGNFLGETFGTSMVRHTLTPCDTEAALGSVRCRASAVVLTLITVGCGFDGELHCAAYGCRAFRFLILFLYYAPCVTQKYVWALGLLAAGQSSTMTGTYTGQFVMSGFLDLKVHHFASCCAQGSSSETATLFSCTQS